MKFASLSLLSLLAVAQNIVALPQGTPSNQTLTGSNTQGQYNNQNNTQQSQNNSQSQNSPQSAYQTWIQNFFSGSQSNQTAIDCGNGQSLNGTGSNNSAIQATCYNQNNTLQLQVTTSPPDNSTVTGFQTVFDVSLLPTFEYDLVTDQNGTNQSEVSSSSNTRVVLNSILEVDNNNTIVASIDFGGDQNFTWTPVQVFESTSNGSYYLTGISSTTGPISGKDYQNATIAVKVDLDVPYNQSQVLQGSVQDALKWSLNIKGWNKLANNSLVFVHSVFSTVNDYNSSGTVSNNSLTAGKATLSWANNATVNGNVTVPIQVMDQPLESIGYTGPDTNFNTSVSSVNLIVNYTDPFNSFYWDPSLGGY